MSIHYIILQEMLPPSGHHKLLPVCTIRPESFCGTTALYSTFFDSPKKVISSAIKILLHNFSLPYLKYAPANLCKQLLSYVVRAEILSASANVTNTIIIDYTPKDNQKNRLLSSEFTLSIDTCLYPSRKHIIILRLACRILIDYTFFA